MWHPKQQVSHEPDGQLLLEVPFTDTRELTMDILRHGRHVEVLEPVDLRNAVADDLASALTVYRDDAMRAHKTENL